MVRRRAALAGMLGLAVSLGPAARGAVPDADIAEVRRLARESVETLFAGASVGQVSDADYGKPVRRSPTPVSRFSERCPRSR
jgi:hypothetical protein